MWERLEKSTIPESLIWDKEESKEAVRQYESSVDLLNKIKRLLVECPTCYVFFDGRQYSEKKWIDKYRAFRRGDRWSPCTAGSTHPRVRKFYGPSLRTLKCGPGSVITYPRVRNYVP